MNDLTNNINPVENNVPQDNLENITNSTIAMLNNDPTSNMVEGVQPSGIETSGIGAPIYAIGQLGYDFGTETKKNIWEQRLDGKATDPKVMIAFLKNNPHDATELIWTLSQDTVPIYAVHPYGAYAAAVYARIIQIYEAQVDGAIQRVAVAGQAGGSSHLLDGHIVGNVNVSSPRNIVAWNTQDLANAALGSRASAAAKSNFENFLQRIYHELRNHGVTNESRALNYAATNAAQAGSVFTQAFKDGMQLASITATPSPIARPGTVTYDVNMTFFDPTSRFEKAKKVFRFMVDISHVMPVGVGQVRSWSVY